MSKVGLAITGNGIVGHRFIEDLFDKSDTTNFNITVFCGKPCIAYDRVHLSHYFSHHTAGELPLVREGFYEKHGIKVLVGERAITINRQEKVIHPNAGCAVLYGKLIMTTGSCPWTLPIKGPDTQDYFAYRIIKDLDAIESCVRRSKYGTVVGDSLLGLEAADAPKNLGIETYVIELAPMLMAEQLDQMGGERLRRKTENMGVRVYASGNTLEIIQEGAKAHKTICFAGDSRPEVDFIVFSTGIRPHDKLTTQYGLNVTPRGGIVANDSCQTSDPDICAIGEYASWNNRVFGLVAPNYEMTQVTAGHILGGENASEGTDLSAKLKLLGVDVGSIGDAHGRMPGIRSYVYLDESKEIYKRLIVNEDNKTLLGAVLVGDTSNYGNPLQLVLNVIELPEDPGSLILPAHSGNDRPSVGIGKLSDSAQIYSCFDVTKDDLTAIIDKGCHTVAALEAETKTGIGCGGYIPSITRVSGAELAKQGIEVNNNLCEHFAYSCQGLFHSIRVEGIKTSEELLAKHSRGYGCEIYRPTVSLLLASCWNEYILKLKHTPLQDSNDNFLADIQKDGTYSVIPRSPGGEITPGGLMAVGRIAREFNLYIKIIGSQRLTMFDAQKDNLPKIWCQLTEVGFEAGHAHAKALRMVKICMGSIWCRYGVGDSVGLGMELENRYKDIRTPHEIKFSVSGCVRECSEAQGKDVGVIATEKGWNLYVRGSGGMKPRHTDLLAAGIDCETPIKYLDRFMMFYIRTADRLTRTASWLEDLGGGINYLRMVTIDDKLRLNAHLEEEMARLREAVVCEWAETVNTPSAQTHFKHLVNSNKRDPDVQMVSEREQHRPTTPYECIPVTLVENNA